MKVKRKIDIWYGRLQDAERYPYLPYWQAQSDEKKFEDAWQMVINAYAIKGEDVSELRLDKTVASFQRCKG